MDRVDDALAIPAVRLLQRAARRSELVGLEVGDLRCGDDGLEVTIRRSKTDRGGLGCKVGIAYGGRRRTCSVRDLRDGLDLSYVTEGPLSRVALTATLHMLALVAAPSGLPAWVRGWFARRRDVEAVLHLFRHRSRR